MPIGKDLEQIGDPVNPNGDEHIVADEVLGREVWKIIHNFDARKPPGPVTIDIAARVKETAPNPAETEPLRGTSLMNTLVGVNWSPRMWVGVCVVVIIIVMMIAPKKKQPAEEPKPVQSVQQPAQPQQGTKQKPIPWPYVPK